MYENKTEKEFNSSIKWNLKIKMNLSKLIRLFIRGKESSNGNVPEKSGGEIRT
jgi:hypothetical protein